MEQLSAATDATEARGNGTLPARPHADFPLDDRHSYSLTAQADLDGLAAVQSSMMRNYFRLLRAQEELERRTRALHAADSDVLEQLEQERERLAHELHAGAGQALAGIKIHLELIDAFLPAPGEQVRASLHRIGLLAQEALQQVRSVAHRIDPPDWGRNTLAGALERLWDITGIPRKYEAHLELAALELEPPRSLQLLLYRVAQEALTNAVRHAAATRLRMRLARRATGEVELSLEDNGKGFDPGAPGGAAGGIGLASMARYLRRAGGDLRIESGPWGTRLTAWVRWSEK